MLEEVWLVAVTRSQLIGAAPAFRNGATLTLCGEAAFCHSAQPLCPEGQQA